jgi:hypothetical protein
MEERDLGRMRFVAARYHELQGLRATLIGSAFTTTMGLALGLRWPPDDTAWFTAAGAAFALLIPGMLWLDRFYRTRFGKTAPVRGFWSLGNLMPMVMVPLLLVDMQFNGRLGLYFLAWAAFALWVTVRDWRYRSYHILDVALGAIAAVLSAPLGAAYGSYQPALMTGFFLIGSGMMVTGLLDHGLLVSSMPLTRDAREQGHADAV